ncbi:hypothetical protein GR160_07750 [Flavobacterium sp. Sd200]|uniref:hypothetical protein n=1 Tax=Flavobacterium sp. Sd200 TaxID=2692211 RepID=UPI0013683773|nr:hypothetical protein [Flavobacterium sp. Sd200]MXN91122.1 hypothetical protein [Flavobacterium sp. Sd200]
MMLYEFLMLDEQQQFRAVWGHGVYIDSVIYNNLDYQLYSINSFYVEVVYDAFTNKIVGKQAFRQGEHLEKYLKKMPLI